MLRACRLVPGLELRTRVALAALGVLTSVVFLALYPGSGRQEAAARRARLALSRGRQAQRGGRRARRMPSSSTPNFVPALYALGRAYYAKGWYLDAARELNRAAEREAGAIPIRLALGAGIPCAGRLNKAEEQAEAIRGSSRTAPRRLSARSRPDREGRSQRGRRAPRARTGRCGRDARDAQGIWRCPDAGTSSGQGRGGIPDRAEHEPPADWGPGGPRDASFIGQGKRPEATKLLDEAKQASPDNPQVRLVRSALLND